MAQSALRNLPLERMNARRERAGMEAFVPQAPTKTAGQAMADMLGGMSIPLSVVPVAGDFAGLAADAAMYATRPEERTLGNAAMTLAGIVPGIPGAAAMRAGGQAAEGALDMSQAARMQRAVGQERPFDINQEWYIGTPVNIESTPEKGFRAAKTENVGRDVIFGTDSPLIAEEYSRGTVSFDEDPLTGKFPVVESNYRNQSPSGGVYRVFSGAQNPKRIDAKGKKWFELPMNQITSNAFDEGHDAVIYENIIDSMYGSSFPSNVIVWKNPSDVRSIKAAFDPSKRSSGELLASVAGGAVGLSALRQLMPQQEQE